MRACGCIYLWLRTRDRLRTRAKLRAKVALARFYKCYLTYMNAPKRKLTFTADTKATGKD